MGSEAYDPALRPTRPGYVSGVTVQGPEPAPADDLTNEPTDQGRGPEIAAHEPVDREAHAREDEHERMTAAGFRKVRSAWRR